MIEATFENQHQRKEHSRQAECVASEFIETNFDPRCSCSRARQVEHHCKISS